MGPQVAVPVQPRSYQAWIENGVLARAGSVLGDLLTHSMRIFVITVPPARKRWGTKVAVLVLTIKEGK